MQETNKLGDILVEREILSRTTVQRVLAMSNKLGKDFGFLLEEMGLITETELVQALASQYQLKPLFDFAKRTFLPEVLRVVTAEVALENMLFPLQIAGGKLALAIADPTRSNIADNISANNGLSVVCFLSTKNEIKTAICRHYFGKDRVEPTEKTVLIVEDNKAILAAMKEILSKHYRVVTATDGLDAYKEVISTKPHVVLTDMEMPKLSGFGLLYALRAVPETRLIPIILISGTTSATAEAQAFQKGFFDFIPKPVKETTLLTRVQRAYEFSQQQNQLFLN